jgi:hypothetical protein
VEVSRQTLDNGAAPVQARSGGDLSARLGDAPRSGRPPTRPGMIAPVSEAVIDEDPRDFGYRAPVWTAPLLQPSLREGPQLPASRQRVSLALARLRGRWKRPRYAPARQAPTCRQAQGGLNRGGARGSGR